MKKLMVSLVLITSLAAISIGGSYTQHSNSLLAATYADDQDTTMHKNKKKMKDSTNKWKDSTKKKHKDTASKHY